jgi:hypothetical protein
MQKLITGLLLVIKIHLNMIRASSCPSSRAYKLQQQTLVYRSNVVVATLLPLRPNGKPEAAAAVDRLLMMDKRMPETC